MSAAYDRSGHQAPLVDYEQPHRSTKGRVKRRAEELSQWEFGDANEWQQYVEQAKNEIDWENYEAWLAGRGWEFIANHKYPSPTGALLYEVLRYNFKLLPRTKIFVPRHRVGDKWVRGTGPARVPYNLLALLAQPDAEITLVEGEKGVEFLRGVGVLAACVQGQNWTADVAHFYTGRVVNIAMDRDDAGQKNIERAVHWLGKVAATVRIIEVPGAEPGWGLDDWIAAHSVEEYLAIVAQTPVVGRVNAQPYIVKAEEEIERYDWLYGGHLLRGEVSGTAAMGGTGKSSKSIMESVELVIGKQLGHDAVPRAKRRVVLINLEDNRNTMDKRIAAVMRRYKLSKDDLGDRLVVLAKGEIIITIAKQRRGGDVERNEQCIAMLTKLMLDHQADVLSIDSFIRTHSVNENDNTAVQKVIACFEDVAKAGRCAIHLWHHTRKARGDQASVESARGAQAFIDSCRSVRIMETMTSKEFDDVKALLPQHEHESSAPGYFFRVFNGKRNFAPPADQSDWFKFESIKLRNFTTDFENDGDNVGVITPWQYPRLDLPMMNDAAHHRVLDKIKASGPWRADSRSEKEPWVGVAVAAALNLDLMDPRAKRAVIALIKKLKQSGKLRQVARTDAHREERQYIEVAAVNASAAKNAE